MDYKKVLEIDESIKEVLRFYAGGSGQLVTNGKYKKHIDIFNKAIRIVNDGFELYPELDLTIESYHKKFLDNMFQEFYILYLDGKWERVVKSAKQKVKDV